MAIYAKDALANKHALVTGATGGIGSATARVLAEMGADVTMTGRREEKLEQLADEIRGMDPNAKIHTCTADIAQAEDRDKLVDAAQQAQGPINLLVNNAGISGGGPVGELEQSEMEKVMHLNYTATVLLTQRIYLSMKEERDGAIVNVASLSGLRGAYGGTAYAASKFALIGFTHSLAVEAIEHGVRVNAVCPGFVDTKMGEASVQKKAEREQHSFDDVVKGSIPSGRMTDPKELAHAIAFLLTDAAENIVGESMKISGGGLLR